MRLLNERILVKPLPPAEKTSGGIVLPATSKPKYLRSEVVAVGDGHPPTAHSPARALRVAPGDVVYHFAPGSDFDFDGEPVKLLSEGDVIGVE